MSEREFLVVVNEEAGTSDEQRVEQVRRLLAAHADVKVARTGSIAAAGREMGMSYKRAWQLVETMNAMFREPLVESTRGGARGGGAEVTETGQAVLAEFRGLEDTARKAGADHIARLQAMLRDIPDGK